MLALVKSTNYRKVLDFILHAVFYKVQKSFLFKPVKERNETLIANINICTEQEQTSAAWQHTAKRPSGDEFCLNQNLFWWFSTV